MNDVQRLEAERLRPMPADRTAADDYHELIGLLYAAIRDDQLKGTWGRR